MIESSRAFDRVESSRGFDGYHGYVCQFKKLCLFSNSRIVINNYFIFLIFNIFYKVLWPFYGKKGKIEKHVIIEIDPELSGIVALPTVLGESGKDNSTYSLRSLVLLSFPLSPWTVGKATTPSSPWSIPKSTKPKPNLIVKTGAILH